MIIRMVFSDITTDDQQTYTCECEYLGEVFRICTCNSCL